LRYNKDPLLAAYIFSDKAFDLQIFESYLQTTSASRLTLFGAGGWGEALLEELQGLYAGRGVNLVRVAGKWAFRTADDLSFLLERQAVDQRRLSRAAVETLAIIAYHQPVTRAEIEEIRGVSVSRGTVDQLLELDWIKFGRRKMTPGRPVTYVVTQGFLDHFGLESARDLPGLKELRAAGLLENRPPPGDLPGEDEIEGEEDQTELFEEESEEQEAQ